MKSIQQQLIIAAIMAAIIDLFFGLNDKMVEITILWLDAANMLATNVNYLRDGLLFIILILFFKSLPFMR